MKTFPFVDAHVHLWDLSHIRYPWLTPPFTPGPAGVTAPIAVDYGLDDYLADAAKWNVKGFVHVDAGADPRDRISLRDHIVEADIGAFQQERGQKQRLRFNVVVEVRPHPAPLDDDVDRILSYDRITESIASELAAERLNLLETLAERVGGGAHPADEEDGGHAGHGAEQRVGGNLDAVDRDAGKARGIFIAADGAHVAAPFGHRQ